MSVRYTELSNCGVSISRCYIRRTVNVRLDCYCTYTMDLMDDFIPGAAYAIRIATEDEGAKEKKDRTGVIQLELRITTTKFILL